MERCLCISRGSRQYADYRGTSLKRNRPPPPITTMKRPPLGSYSKRPPLGTYSSPFQRDLG